MSSESREFITPSRTGRMTGVNITIDGETWEYILNHAGIPLDTPLSDIQIKRYRTRDSRIILKVKVKPHPIPEPTQIPAIIAFVSETPQPQPKQPYELLESGAIQCGNHHSVYCHENNGCDLFGKCPYYKTGFPDGDF